MRRRPRSRTASAASRRWRSSRHHRARGGGRRRRSATRGTEVAAKLAGRARAARRAARRAGSEEKALVDQHPRAAREAARRRPAGRRRRAEPATTRPRRAAQPSCSRSRTSWPTLQGESPLIMPTVDAQAVASVVADWTGIPVGPHGEERARDVLRLGETLGQRVIGQQHGAGHDRPAHPDLARAARQPEQADRRVHAVRHLGRRQDRDRARAGRGAVRRRAERHHHQHERVPGGAHGLHAQGRAAGLRGLRRRRHPDRGGAPPALQRGAARRGREGAPRRARAVLPGLRQGPHGRRRRPHDRLQEHDHPADLATPAPS